MGSGSSVKKLNIAKIIYRFIKISIKIADFFK